MPSATDTWLSFDLHRWWVNWKDPIFNQDRATVEDSEASKTDLRRTESEPDLTFNYSKLTGEIDGEDGDRFAPNGQHQQQDKNADRYNEGRHDRKPEDGNGGLERRS